MLKRLLCVLALVAAAGCLPAPATTVTPGSPFQAETLTVDGGDRYTLTGDASLAVASASAANTSNNTRALWTIAWQPPTVDQAVCATWVAAPGTAQPGLMLRWDGVHGISITRNVWARVTTVIHVHTWDLSAPDGGGRFDWLAAFPLTGIGWPSPDGVALPWRACATATGPLIRFKVWPLTSPEPAIGDLCCTGAVSVSHLGPGRPGWYAGHIEPGASLVVTNLTTS